MAGTYSQLLYHFTFSTKGRAQMITPDLEPRLHAFMGGIVREQRGVALTIGGMPDHVHLYVRWRTDATIADLLRNVKSRSSSWVHETFPGFRAFQWQEGYGAFTVSQSQSEIVKRYIAHQKEHHRKQSFQEEFIDLLKAHEIEYDERYIWD